MIAKADIVRVKSGWATRTSTTRRYLHHRPQHDDAALVTEAFAVAPAIRGSGSAIDHRAFRPRSAAERGRLPLGPMNTGRWWPKWARPPSRPLSWMTVGTRVVGPTSEGEWWRAERQQPEGLW